MKRISLKTSWILIGILLLASWVRLYHVTLYIPFWNEQVDDLLSVREIWQSIATGKFDHLSLKGQTGTYRWSYLSPNESNPIYHGVMYYYMLLPAAVFSHFDPLGVVLFLVVLGIGTIYLLYWAGVLLFESVSVGLLAAFFGAMSFWLSAYSRWIWTPSMMPFFSALTLVSFLQVRSGRVLWWYPLVLSISVGSQIHDSGYMLMLFYGLALLVYRPKFPKKFWNIFWVICLGFLPLFPTVVNEIRDGFGMVRALSSVAYYSATTFSSLGTGVWEFVKAALGFMMMSQQYRDLIVGYIVAHGTLFGFITAAIFLFGIFRGKNVKTERKAVRKFTWNTRNNWLFWWWLLCFPVSMFVEYLYLDQGINDYSRMNTMAYMLPILYISVAYVCVVFWRYGTFLGRLVIIVGIYVFVCLNTLVIRDYLWTYGERDWAYEDLKTVSMLIPHHASGEPYDLQVFRYNEGSYESKRVYEMLYFIEQFPARMPETFNDVSYWGITREPLLARKARQKIIVMDKAYLKQRDLPYGVSLVDSTLGYVIYRLMY